MMKKVIIFICFIVTISAFPFVASANIADPGKNIIKDTICSTQYPIVLSHGMGWTATGKLGVGYWYGIPDQLTACGANVFISDQTAMAATTDRAVQLQKYVLYVLATTGAQKVNIIGHSQGGLDARYMISNLYITDPNDSTKQISMATKVASLTTVASPHRGSSVADVLLGWDQDLNGWISGLVDDVYLWLFGGKQNASACALFLNTKFMTNIFNPTNPDNPGVYYQSRSSTMIPSALPDKALRRDLGTFTVRRRLE
jgi:triacylglycerol lipase